MRRRKMMVTWVHMILVVVTMMMTTKQLRNQDRSPDPEALHLVHPVHQAHHQDHQGLPGPVQALDLGPGPVVKGEDSLGQGNG